MANVRKINQGSTSPLQKNSQSTVNSSLHEEINLILKHLEKNPKLFPDNLLSLKILNHINEFYSLDDDRKMHDIIAVSVMDYAYLCFQTGNDSLLSSEYFYVMSDIYKLFSIIEQPKLP